MKFFIKVIVYTLAFTAPCGTIYCSKKPNKLEVSIPLQITNPTDSPITIHLDLRVDYYYSHPNKTKSTFLPASQILMRLTVKPRETIAIPIPLPQKLHEPYNGFKNDLRIKKYEMTDMTIRGAIIVADDPKKFSRISASLTNQESYSITLYNSIP